MSDTAFCGECGTQISASAKFCPSCGTAQESDPGPPALHADEPKAPSLFATPRGEQTPPAPPEPPVPPATPTTTQPSAQPPPAAAGPAEPLQPRAARPGAQQRVERVAPGAGELAGELAQRLQTPGVVAAAIVAGVALLTCLAVGVLTAVLSPDKTFIGFLHGEDGILTEALRLTVATTLATVSVGGEGGTGAQLLPMIFGLAPLLGAAVGARLAAPSLTGMPARAAIAWSAAGAVIFAVAMMVLALVANGQEHGAGIGLRFSIGSVLFMSLLLVGTGAAIGAARAAAKLAPDRPAIAPPPAAATALRIVTPPLLALGALLAISAIVGFAHIEVQSIRGQEQAVTSVRSELAAALETILFVPDIAVDTAGLAVLAQFDQPVLPVDDGEQVDFAESLDDEGEGRIFAYSSALPIYVFLPELLILLGAALIAALYAGFAMARRATAPTALIAAAWGAITGIVWALALVILRALAFGPATLGDSVFAGALLIGTVAGAAGGFLAFGPALGRSTPAHDVADG